MISFACAKPKVKLIHKFDCICIQPGWPDAWTYFPLTVAFDTFSHCLTRLISSTLKIDTESIYAGRQQRLG